MTVLYAITLIFGLIALLLWVAATAVAASVEGWSFVDPEDRFGASGRMVVASLVGFGMAGMSASFAGWNPGQVVGAAIAGVLFAAFAARYLGPES